MLTELESSTLKPKQYVLEENYPPVEKIRSLLCDVLITEDGEVDWENRDKLSAAGNWYAYPYERDRFGWLLGALVTTKGDIVFG